MCCLAQLCLLDVSFTVVDHALARIDQLLDLMPEWLEKVVWAKPHLRLKNSDRSIKEVIDEANEKVAQKGIV